MAETVHIPKADTYEDGTWWQPGHPAWMQAVDAEGRKVKPTIRCNCGQWSGIGLHHVHADGRVTASFFHATKAQHPQGDDSGCGWHVFLILDGYDGGEFPPDRN
jgi:hypothetical protein